MKSNKGITLMSVIIYVIGMLIIVTVISVITGYFYKNVDVGDETYNTSQQYTKFNSYFSKEVNMANNKLLEVGEHKSQKYIAFSSGNQYTYINENESIYRNNVKIASNIKQCTFEKNTRNGKDVISVELVIGEDPLPVNTTYTLNN